MASEPKVYIHHACFRCDCPRSGLAYQDPLLPHLLRKCGLGSCSLQGSSITALSITCIADRLQPWLVFIVSMTRDVGISADFKLILVMTETFFVQKYSYKDLLPLVSRNISPRGRQKIMTGTSQLLAVLSAAAFASAQVIPTASQCPSANGQTITDNNGSTYKVTCSSDNSVGSYSNTDASSSYLDCMTACDTAVSAGCKGFTYVGGTGGVGSGICWLKKSMGTYTTASSRYISAVKISDAVSSANTNVASTLATSVSSTASVSSAAVASSTNLCPSGNFTTYIDTAGSNWQVLCGFDTSPGSFGSTSASTFQSCLQACKTTTNCAAVTYIGTACYFKKSFSSLITKSSANSAFLVNTQKYPVPVSGNSRASSGCGAALPAGVQLGGASRTFQITSSGKVRSFNVHVPTSYKNNRAAPLIIGYHGRSNNQLSVESDSQLSSETWNPFAIAVYPLGINVSGEDSNSNGLEPWLTRNRENGKVIQTR